MDTAFEHQKEQTVAWLLRLQSQQRRQVLAEVLLDCKDDDLVFFAGLASEVAAMRDQLAPGSHLLEDVDDAAHHRKRRNDETIFSDDSTTSDDDYGEAHRHNDKGDKTASSLDDFVSTRRGLKRDLEESIHPRLESQIGKHMALDSEKKQGHHHRHPGSSKRKNRHASTHRHDRRDRRSGSGTRHPQPSFYQGPSYASSGRDDESSEDEREPIEQLRSVSPFQEQAEAEFKGSVQQAYSQAPLLDSVRVVFISSQLPMFWYLVRAAHNNVLAIPYDYYRSHPASLYREARRFLRGRRARSVAFVMDGRNGEAFLTQGHSLLPGGSGSDRLCEKLFLHLTNLMIQPDSHSGVSGEEVGDHHFEADISKDSPTVQTKPLFQLFVPELCRPLAAGDKETIMSHLQDVTSSRIMACDDVFELDLDHEGDGPRQSQQQALAKIASCFDPSSFVFWLLYRQQLQRFHMNADGLLKPMVQSLQHDLATHIVTQSLLAVPAQLVVSKAARMIRLSNQLQPIVLQCLRDDLTLADAISRAHTHAERTKDSQEWSLLDTLSDGPEPTFAADTLTHTAAGSDQSGESSSSRDADILPVAIVTQRLGTILQQLRPLMTHAGSFRAQVLDPLAQEIRQVEKQLRALDKADRAKEKERSDSEAAVQSKRARPNPLHMSRLDFQFIFGDALGICKDMQELEALSERHLERLSAPALRGTVVPRDDPLWTDIASWAASLDVHTRGMLDNSSQALSRLNRAKNQSETLCQLLFSLEEDSLAFDDVDLVGSIAALVQIPFEVYHGVSSLLFGSKAGGNGISRGARLVRERTDGGSQKSSDSCQRALTTLTRLTAYCQAFLAKQHRQQEAETRMASKLQEPLSRGHHGSNKALRRKPLTSHKPGNSVGLVARLPPSVAIEPTYEARIDAVRVQETTIDLNQHAGNAVHHIADDVVVYRGIERAVVLVYDELVVVTAQQLERNHLTCPPAEQLTYFAALERRATRLNAIECPHGPYQFVIRLHAADGKSVLLGFRRRHEFELHAATLYQLMRRS